MQKRMWRMMGMYDAETSTYSACAGTAAPSPWTPDFNGSLVAIRTQASMTAASSLTGHIQFKLTCNKFSPNAIEVFAQGNGLQTAPAMAQLEKDFAVAQVVQAGVPVTIEGRCVDCTPVTVQAYVWGLFEVS